MSSLGKKMSPIPCNGLRKIKANITAETAPHEEIIPAACRAKYRHEKYFNIFAKNPEGVHIKCQVCNIGMYKAAGNKSVILPLFVYSRWIKDQVVK